MHDRLAHTAEHAFIGSLQKLLRQTLCVRKVEHRDSSNTVFIVIPHLDLDLVVKAQSQVNVLIQEANLRVLRLFAKALTTKSQAPKLARLLAHGYIFVIAFGVILFFAAYPIGHYLWVASNCESLKRDTQA